MHSFTRWKKIITISCGLITGACCMHSVADIYVIVNNANPTPSITKKQTIDIFMGKTKSFSDGVHIQAIDQPADTKTRKEFYKNLTGKSLAYVNAYWARLFYTGRNQPPLDHFPDSNAIIYEVTKNNHAIAYIEADTPPEGVKIVYLLTEKD